MALFARIRRIKRGGLVGGSVSLGMDFEISKAHTKTRVSLSLPTDQGVVFSYCFNIYLYATMLIMN